jgi:hypothetical protein
MIGFLARLVFVVMLLQVHIRIGADMDLVFLY